MGLGRSVLLFGGEGALGRGGWEPQRRGYLGPGSSFRAWEFVPPSPFLPLELVLPHLPTGTGYHGHCPGDVRQEARAARPADSPAG